jgi:hypothetical protein
MAENQETLIDNRFRTLLILWFAMLMNVVMFYLFLVFAFAPSAEPAPNNTLSLTLLIVGTLLVIVSFPIKRRFLNLSVEKQKLDLVNTGLVLAWAISEVATMLGMLDRFLTGNRYYFVLFLISAAGIALNFPRRDHLLAATYKKTSF